MKKIDEDLGGSTPLNIIVKFPANEKKTRRMMMNLMSGKMKTMKRTNLNIGSQGIKWIKL